MMKTIYLFLALSLVTLAGNAQDLTYGCTDPSALNYDPLSMFDNGSCCYTNWVTVNVIGDIPFVDIYSTTIYATVYTQDEYHSFCASEGCYSLICPFLGDPTATITILLNGAVLATYTNEELMLIGGVIPFQIGTTVNGCTDSMACNYDSNANCDDGLCDYSCTGCTDPTSFNYDPDATIDNGSCCSSSNYITITFEFPDAPSTYFILENNNYGPFNSGYSGSSFCVPDGCYSIYGSYAPSETPNVVTVTNADGEILAQGAMNSLEGNQELSFEVNAISGCTDPSACNFNPASTCNDYYSCTYDCFGCTDPEALNYDPEATVDDGSCCQNSFTIVADGPFQWQVYSYSIAGGAYGYYPANNSFCINDGCFNLVLYSIIDLENDGIVNWQILDANGELAYSGTTETWGGSEQISINATSGCMETSACNYNPLANCYDSSVCEYSCYGCTDPNAPNYNPESTLDNGSCCTADWYTISADTPGSWNVTDPNGFSTYGHWPEQSGFCIQPGCFSLSYYADNFDMESVTVSLNDGEYSITGNSFEALLNGLVIFVSNGTISGCTDPGACNYDSNATCSDYYMCDYSCYGCMDASAPNYNPDVTIDNGTCCYSNWYNIELSAPGYWTVSAYVDGTYQYGEYPAQSGFCVDAECFQVSAWTAEGLEATFTVTDPSGNVVAEGVTDYLFSSSELIALGDYQLGCSEPGACNYDPAANCSDYTSCDYSCYGCTDADAPNYDPNATIDNGTCCTSTWYTLSVNGQAYWYAFDAYYNGGAGFYPDQNGFCMPSSCFAFYIYNFQSEPISYAVTDNLGNVYATGNAYPGAYTYTSVSTVGEISGCTDESSCNYNPEAVCNDGSCTYFCGGCVDPSALNYNEQAQFDDGSCFYNVVPPLMGMSMVPDEENNQYYLLMNMMDEGNGAPYVMSSNYNSQMMILETSGEYLAGPYPCDAVVDFTLQSLEAGMATYLSADMEGACSIVNGVEDATATSSIQVFPNPNNGQFTITGIAASRVQLRITDMSGRMILDESTNVSNGRIDKNLSDLTNGIYQVSIVSSTDIVTERMVINK